MRKWYNHVDISRYKMRVGLVCLCFFVMFAIIALRLFLLQVRQKDFFMLLARSQYQTNLSIVPARAEIFDRSGSVALAFNRQVQSAFVLKNQCKDIAKLNDFLRRHYPDVYKKMNEHPQQNFFWIERKLSSERYSWLKGADVCDINFVGEDQRVYAQPSLGQVIGITDVDNVGLTGTELLFSEQLCGSPTLVSIEKDARSGSFYFEQAVQQQGKKGDVLRLSIDSTLQSLAWEQLKQTVEEYEALVGTVLIVNPDNGQVLALANYPSFDPNQKCTDLDLLKNNAVNECYELGSVFKVFTALGALEQGVVDMDEEIDCEGKVSMVNRVRVENWRRFETMTFRDVVRYSSNIGIAKVSMRLGHNLYDHLTMLGFGRKTGIELPGERDGFVNHPSKWSRPSVIVLSFGYEIMATLAQLARAFCTIANGGYDVPLTLLCQSKGNVAHARRLYKEKTIEDVKSILTDIGVRYPVDGFQVMGKTGSARCVKDGKYSPLHHNYTFAGIVEQGAYKRVVITFIKEPKKYVQYASQVTAPLFQRIAHKMALHDLMSLDVTVTNS
ncbi:MAG: penicillin-binding protein 2 [Epsilonproteobacteria bacterium]|nr:penicillin-binding protein 2 [Campylobacterota bacterium]